MHRIGRPRNGPHADRSHRLLPVRDAPIASAIAVIFARNPVHSVLWLILAFFNAAG
jgi:hypothetical protein